MCTKQIQELKLTACVLNSNNTRVISNGKNKNNIPISATTKIFFNSLSSLSPEKI